MSLQNLIAELRKYTECMEMNEPLSHHEVENFEKTNKIKLPASYVELLCWFDGGELFIPGTIIYGLNHESAGYTLKEINGRENRQLFSIPKSMLIIGKLNYGDWLCIDLNHSNKIVQWDHEDDSEFCQWEDLESWLKETIEEYERYEGGI